MRDGGWCGRPTGVDPRRVAEGAFQGPVALMIVTMLVVGVLAIGRSMRVEGVSAQSDGGLTPVAQVGGPVYAVAGSRDRRTAYVGIGPRVIAYDLCDPSFPVERGRTGVLPGIVRHIVLDGTLAYVAVGDPGVVVLDVSDPARPRQVGALDVNGVAAKTLVDGRWVYVVAGSEGFAIYDRSEDPRRPRFVSVFDVVASDAAVKGDWAFVVSRNLKLVDLSDRGRPDERQAMVDWADAVAVHGNTLVVGVADELRRDERTGRLWMFDVTDPERARPLIGSIPVGFPVRDIRMVGDVAWTLAGSELVGVDLVDPSSPRLVEGGRRGHLPASALRLAAVGSRLLVSAGGAGLHAVRPPDMRAQRVLDAMGSADTVAYADGIAYVEDEDEGAEGIGDRVLAIDVRDPLAPRRIATLATGVSARAITAGDGLLVIGSPDPDNELIFVDVRDPRAPLEIARLALPERIWRLARRGDLVYVANDRSLRVVEARGAAAPRVLGTLRPESGVTDITLTDDPCCVVITGPDTRRDTGHDGLEVIDVSNPGAPRTRGAAQVDGWRNGLTGSGGVVAGGAERLQLFDVSNSSAPRRISEVEHSGESEDRAWLGGRIYQAAEIADRSGAVQVFDVTDPQAAEQTEVFDPLFGAEGVAVGPGRVIVAAGEAGLWILSPDGPLAPPTPAPVPTRLPETIFVPIVARGPIGDHCR